jgi:hypothetical protein
MSLHLRTLSIILLFEFKLNEQNIPKILIIILKAGSKTFQNKHSNMKILINDKIDVLIIFKSKAI